MLKTKWADLFLYPILADLRCVKDGVVLQKFPKLDNWVKRMSKRRSAEATVTGTLADGYKF